MPNMSHCQITRSMRVARHLGIIKPDPNPTTNPNPNLNHNPNRNQRNKYLINKHLRTRLCEIAQWRRWKLLGTARYLILHRECVNMDNTYRVGRYCCRWTVRVHYAALTLWTRWSQNLPRNSLHLLHWCCPISLQWLRVVPWLLSDHLFSSLVSTMCWFRVAIAVSVTPF